MAKEKLMHNGFGCLTGVKNRDAGLDHADDSPEGWAKTTCKNCLKKRPVTILDVIEDQHEIAEALGETEAVCDDCADDFPAQPPHIEGTPRTGVIEGSKVQIGDHIVYWTSVEAPDVENGPSEEDAEEMMAIVQAVNAEGHALVNDESLDEGTKWIKHFRLATDEEIAGFNKPNDGPPESFFEAKHEPSRKRIRTPAERKAKKAKRKAFMRRKKVRGY